jgi:hypothetical protein
LKIKKNLTSNLNDKISIEEYKKSNVMREHRLHNEKKQLEILLQKKMNEKNDLIAYVCKLQANIDEVELEFTKMKDVKISIPTKQPNYKRRMSSSQNLPLKRRNSKRDTDEKFEQDSKLHVNKKLKNVFNYC